MAKVYFPFQNPLEAAGSTLIFDVDSIFQHNIPVPPIQFLYQSSLSLCRKLKRSTFRTSVLFYSIETSYFCMHKEAMKMSYSKLLRKYQELANPQVELLHCSRNEFVIHQNGEARYVYILLKGSIKIFHTNSKDQVFLFGIFKEDEIFGELEAQLQTPFFNSVCCLEDCEIARITHTTYKKWLTSDPDFALYVNQKLCSKILNSSSRMVEYNFFPLEYHVLKYLVEASDDLRNDDLLLNKQDMANYLGSNLRSINRILKQFSDEKMIRSEKDQLQFLDKEKIRKRILQNL